ncbi:MAG: biosynthetic arginine decarboxylase [Synechococcaceae cyanobacterium SM2_3_1]|nr:biosynthetic arginine decarboxylase [Synechococcaceae cyanobacterium SM2_3_1]
MPTLLRSPWTVQESERLYRIKGWGAPYFQVNAAGHVEVVPQAPPSETDSNQAVDLYHLVQDLRARGLQLPLLIRFPDIVADRIHRVCDSFAQAIEQFNYPNYYQGVYPVKVNQQRHLVEDVVRYGKAYQFGLEAGSKPELLIALANLSTPGALLICNGYKDLEYIETALLAQRLGLTPIIVLERLHELTLVIEAAQRLKIAPILGVRAKLSAQGIGRWGSSAGERAKFGLTAGELLEAVSRLQEADMLASLRLLHYHIGSQISTVSVHGRAVREASQLYVELVKMGAPMGYLDMGGGLGIDYDGSQSTAHTSQAYSLVDYAATIVQTVLTTCQDHAVAPPTLVTESGRAIMSHQSVLVFDVLGCSAGSQGSLPTTQESDAPVVHELLSLYHEIQAQSLTAQYRKAVELKDTALRSFTEGQLSLQERARVERLFWNCCDRICNLAYEQLQHTGFDPVGLTDLDEMLAHTYFCNFSLFQSVPDSWAIDQVFPVMPIHRLGEEPRLWGTLADLTCDSDGKINRFFDEEGKIASVLPLHELNDQPYLLGIFLGGAYQEILGDLHNLFGDTNAVHIQLQPQGGYRVAQVVKGDSISEVLGYVQYNSEDLAETIHHATETALQNKRITLEEARLLQTHFDDSLRSYTYLR